MCGFIGFFDTRENKEVIVERMMDRVIHRGPDMGGKYIDAHCGLGFRRLSILDLSEAGAQPLYSEDGNKILVFNGEIYNYTEIREDLMAKGYKFKSNTDSEVLIHGYDEYGEALVNKLRGMFAFCIWDKVEQKVFAARDNFGIKPFYFYEYEYNGQKSLMIASEIKAFLDHPSFEKEVNKKALKPYLTFQYSAQPDETFFKGVKRLKPGHYFTYQNGEMNIQKYWEVNFNDQHKTLEENIADIRAVIDDSVKMHKQSDVPVGSFLSGGVDSSYITEQLMPDKTFSIGFAEDTFDETTHAEDLSNILNIENIKRTIDADDCLGMLSTIQYHMDEPQSNPSTMPLYFLSKLVKDNDVTVVLSGEGADEIFGGYEWYGLDEGQKKLKKLPNFILKPAASLAKHLPNFRGKTTLLRAGRPVEETFIGQALVFEEDEAKDILNSDYQQSRSVKDITDKVYSLVQGKDDVTKKQFLDIKLFMAGDILQKADKMSMAHSLELRVPFLDKEVMKVGEQIGSEQKITNGTTKYVLRKAAEKSLPEEWFKRKKKGFPVPIKLWFQEEKYYQFVKEYFQADYVDQFFDREKINQLLDDHYQGVVNNARKIYTVLVFLVWYKRYFIDEAA
ncbi:asparagine synthase (glutamine-hydrolyzing) [Dolosigranulum pigrum]|uniref:asparagine synthase (glutamine-hydrolyzing) n=1 Tax=Dolosigranulum pigrum TaxID=29394 RepID=UPI001AD87BF6|nr:asparagine synthase (glutamine-hydrolyzing) [Dolosigranulum pigrum]QTJ43286.1 asparagine synthase (glutamine-hydrolyzing) [Dolosigranulum pigrum]QTJ46701.1 asparagine synthase (glutamine-hydrolyzing) [Dolosigranulum pigrum]QTJ60222.1 asparagine synthase (glutamine-hydrolyzing) [Dolosigranulum pigrum]